MEKGLLKLLDDFNSGRLRAFGEGKIIFFVTFCQLSLIAFLFFQVRAAAWSRWR